MVLTFWFCVAGVGPYLPPATKSDPGYPPSEPQTQGTKRPRPEELAVDERASLPPRNGVLQNRAASELGISLRPWGRALQEFLSEF